MSAAAPSADAPLRTFAAAADADTVRLSTRDLKAAIAPTAVAGDEIGTAVRSAGPQLTDPSPRTEPTGTGKAARTGERVRRQPVAVVEVPPDSDLTAVLAAAAPRRWWNRTTVVLLAVILVAAGFVGGVLTQQRWGTTGNTASAGTRTGTRTGTGGFPGDQRFRGGVTGFPNVQPGAIPATGGDPAAGGGPVAGATASAGASASGATASSGAGAPATGTGPTSGTVVSIRGTTLTVRTDDGDIISVQTGASTTVLTAETAELAGIKAGQSVTVDGPTSSDGSITATTITATK